MRNEKLLLYFAVVRLYQSNLKPFLDKIIEILGRGDVVWLFCVEVSKYSVLCLKGSYQWKWRQGLVQEFYGVSKKKKKH